jgi:hypothetical protein
MTMSPQTNGTGIRVVITSPFGAPPENLRTMQVWRSWVEYSSADEDRSVFNRNAVLGFAITLGVSAGFWTGVGLTVARIWK